MATPHTFIPGHHTQTANRLPSQVSELIDEESREWNEGLISTLFWPKDSELILQIPLCLVGTEDLLVWHYLSNDIFSVRLSHCTVSVHSGGLICQQLLGRFPVTAVQGTTRFSENQSLWLRPLSDCIKINFDGGALDGARASGIRGIAHNARGVCVAWLSLHLTRGGSAEIAEAFAAREAIRLALQHRWPRVILEADSSNLLHKLSSNQLDLSAISILIADVLFLSSFFTSIFFFFFSEMFRQLNSTADFLAGWASNQAGDASFLPLGLDSVVRGDFV
ncbi:UNVERIFIED_CONTAM: hypothetical protein Sangu_3163900 [Sesamum angustifolium]|uniref:RNase H type-1 domain-containing protein n=1 Tax=Sesamum angustifolium TaxID=2727405 RepID=A0AAW2JVD8_9LAMI